MAPMALPEPHPVSRRAMQARHHPCVRLGLELGHALQAGEFGVGNSFHKHEPAPIADVVVALHAAGV